MEKEEVKRRRKRYKRPRKPALSPLALLLVVFAAMLVPVLVAKWRPVSAFFLDLKRPVISLPNALPKGLGVTPIVFRAVVTDSLAGIREISVWLRDEGKTREIFRKDAGHSPIEQVDLTLNPAAIGANPGKGELIFQAIDASWWQNTARLRLPLLVDLDKPRVNSFPGAGPVFKEGTSHIVFYKAEDQKLIMSGIRMGEDLFAGIPARQIDKTLPDAGLFVCIFGVPVTGNPRPVKIAAEDVVGNAGIVPLGQTSIFDLSKRIERPVNENMITDHFAPKLLASALTLEKLSREGDPRTSRISEDSVTDDRLWNLKLFVEKIRATSSDDLFSQLKGGPRFERYWNSEFLKPQGEIKSSFGVIAAYTFNGREIASYIQTGIEFISEWGIRDVSAMNDGFVIIQGDFPAYGKVVGIDHGVGVVSVYGNLESTSVFRGERVRKGQHIGLSGSSGLFPANSYYLEMRLSGIPVDPSDWWNLSWYKSEIEGTIESVKRVLAKPARRGK